MDRVASKPIDVIADLSIQGKSGTIIVVADGRSIVFKGQLLRSMMQLKIVVNQIRNAAGSIRFADQLLKRADLSICLRSRRFIILGSNVNPLVLATITVLTRLLAGFFRRK